MDKRVDPGFGRNPAPFSTTRTEDENDASAAVLQFINQILMEEDMEERSSMYHDSLALVAAEKSFYDVIGEKYPSPPPNSSNQQHHHHLPNVESPDDSLSSSDYSISSGGSSYASTCTSSSAESYWSNLTTTTDYNPTVFPNDFHFPPGIVFPSTNSNTANSGFLSTSSMAGFFESTLPRTSDYPLPFDRGVVEQGTEFLPEHNRARDSPVLVGSENTTFFPSFRMAPPQEVVIKTEIDDDGDEEECFPFASKGRRIHQREDEEVELRDARSNKQPAVYIDGSELSELFDKLLLTGLPKGESSTTSGQENEESNRPRGGRRSRFRRNRENDEEVVDLRTLLMQCAQAMSSDNRSAAEDLLEKIKQHASSMGDGTQRLAHHFRIALEARLVGTGTQIYSVLSSTSKNISASDMIKAYQVYNSACPFEKLAIIYANNSIARVAKEADTLHIVDFGIRYGFKWPAFINRLSRREGGPPKLRITGIEHPQPGFRPRERVEETGRRLARYCSRFNVPFEFNAIAQKWETIKVEDLKIRKDEVVAVNCMFRFENLLDGTVVSSNPRGAVLNLIRKANPSIFVHSIVNGSYDAAFFMTRFREALYHYSALFDMLHTNVASENPMRLMFEKEFFGREVVNVIACEGCERVERPQTYKKWQLRNMRAGFKQLPLDQQIFNKLKGRLRDDEYHSRFMLEVDGNWVLQGWKGRILHASSCWVPA